MKNSKMLGGIASGVQRLKQFEIAVNPNDHPRLVLGVEWGGGRVKPHSIRCVICGRFMADDQVFLGYSIDRQTPEGTEEDHAHFNCVENLEDWRKPE